MPKKAPEANLAQSIPAPSKSELDYQTESHLRTLSEAADIVSDPEKMKRVHKLAGRRHKALKGMLKMHKGQDEGAPIKNLSDLKKRAHTMREDDEDGEEMA